MRLYYDARTFMPENPVRGDDDQIGDLFIYVSPEARGPRDRPLRDIWRLTEALARLSPHVDQICPHMAAPLECVSSLNLVRSPSAFQRCRPAAINASSL